MSKLVGPAKMTVTTTTDEAPWEDFSMHADDFKLFIKFISDINKKMVEEDGKYVRCAAVKETEQLGPQDLDILVKYYQDIGLLPDLEKSLPVKIDIPPKFHQKINRSIAYSMQYQLSPKDEKGNSLALDAALDRFVDAYKSAFSPSKVPYHTFGIVEALVLPSIEEKNLKGFRTSYGHSEHASRKDISEAERVLGRLFRRALMFPQLLGNVPQAPKKTDKDHPPDQCTEVISLPFVADSVVRYLQGNPNGVALINCLAIEYKSNDGIIFCPNCDRFAQSLTTDHDGLRIVDKCSGKVYQSSETKRRFDLLDALVEKSGASVE